LRIHLLFTNYPASHLKCGNCKSDEEKQVVASLKKMLNMRPKIIEQEVDLADILDDINSFTFAEIRTVYFKEYVHKFLGQQPY
jgi:hypothetical protein